MKENSDKSHLITSCTKATNAMVVGFPTDFCKAEVLPGITNNHELKFDLNYLYKKAGQKLNALARIAPFSQC